jgi:D-arabinose 5-phosphate isomerase GutQ
VELGTEPLTPPLTADDPEGAFCLSRAVHVLSTAATALSHVTILYQSDPVAREGLLQAVECIKSVNEAGGKLLICGVGKSGLVGRKTVATMKSLGVACSFIHAAEALHGDLGDIRPVRIMYHGDICPAPH